MYPKREKWTQTRESPSVEYFIDKLKTTGDARKFILLKK